MKYCPTCEARYDEDILRFCMKDGTPLLEEAEPTFVEMPSESLEVQKVEDEDDPSEHTVIRRNIPVPPPAIEQPPAPSPPPSPDEDFSDVRPNSGGQRIVVSTVEEQQRERARVAAQYQTPRPARSGVNIFLVVLVTLFGTIIVLGFGGALLYFLVANSSDDSNANSNVNVNANQDINANTNLGANANFDFNSNTSVNTNTNVNATSPTPTPSPSATPRPTESPSPTPDDNEPTPTPTRTPLPTPSPIVIRPGTSPTPLRTPAPTPRTIITPTPRQSP